MSIIARLPKDVLLERLGKLMTEIQHIREEIHPGHHADDSREASVKWRVFELLNGSHTFVSKTYEVLETL